MPLSTYSNKLLILLTLPQPLPKGGAFLPLWGRLGGGVESGVLQLI